MVARRGGSGAAPLSPAQQELGTGCVLGSLISAKILLKIFFVGGADGSAGISSWKRQMGFSPPCSACSWSWLIEVLGKKKYQMGKAVGL